MYVHNTWIHLRPEHRDEYIRLLVEEVRLEPAMMAGDDIGAQARQHGRGRKRRAVDLAGDLFLVGQDRHLAEIGRSGELRHEVARGWAAVLVANGEGDAVQVEGGRVAEHQQLQDRRDEHHHPAPLVLQQGQKFLDHQCLDASQHGRVIPGAFAACAG